MAGFGPPPKPNAQRRNRDTFTGAGVTRCPECGTPRRDGDACDYCGTPAGDTESPPAPGPRIAAPELPDAKKWHPSTRAWWDAWTRSAQVSVFEPSEWHTLKALLPLVDAMNRENSDPIKRAKLFEHVHRAEKALGGTHMDRLRARIDVSRESAPAGGVAHGDDGHAPEGVAILDEYRGMGLDAS